MNDFHLVCLTEDKTDSQIRSIRITLLGSVADANVSTN